MKPTSYRLPIAISLVAIMVVSIMAWTSILIISSYASHESPTRPQISNQNFTYAPNYVRFHIYPESEGIIVLAWTSNNFTPPPDYAKFFIYSGSKNREISEFTSDNRRVQSGLTNINSEIDLELLSTSKYNIIVDYGTSSCNFQMYPSQSYYEVRC